MHAMNKCKKTHEVKAKSIEFELNSENKNLEMTYNIA